MRRLLEIIALTAFAAILAAMLFCGVARGQSIPQRAFEYRQTLRSEAARIWGMGQATDIFGAQIHQESSWRPDAQSPYARGIAQFTPDTEEWIEQLDPGLRQIGGGAFNPRWGIRALVYYDRWLWERIEARNEVERWAFVLRSYNGGKSWLDRERRAAAAAGFSTDCNYDAVELFCGRTDPQTGKRRAAWACKENLDYPRRIQFKLLPIYKGF